MSDGMTDANRGYHSPAKVQQPTIGRIVHYTSHTAQGDMKQSAAIVTGVTDDDDLGTPGLKRITLTVFEAGAGTPWLVDFIEYSEAPRNGYWSWPPRV
jgi:hypothetical protein